MGRRSDDLKLTPLTPQTPRPLSRLPRRSLQFAVCGCPIVDVGTKFFATGFLKSRRVLGIINALQNAWPPTTAVVQYIYSTNVDFTSTIIPSQFP